MADLRPPCRLEIRQEIELATVVGAVVPAAQGDDAVGLVAPAERPRYEVGRVDGAAGAADETGEAGDLEALSGRGGRRRGRLQ